MRSTDLLAAGLPSGQVAREIASLAKLAGRPQLGSGSESADSGPR
jgi:hypothetical protein